MKPIVASAERLVWTSLISSMAHHDNTIKRFPPIISNPFVSHRALLPSSKPYQIKSLIQRWIFYSRHTSATVVIPSHLTSWLAFPRPNPRNNVTCLEYILTCRAFPSQSASRWCKTENTTHKPHSLPFPNRTEPNLSNKFAFSAHLHCRSKNGNLIYVDTTRRQTLSPEPLSIDGCLFT